MESCAAVAYRRRVGTMRRQADHNNVILILLAENPILNQVHLHALRMREPPQGAAEHDAVKSGQGSLNLVLESGARLFRMAFLKMRCQA
jgi:hypothetical protein